MCWHEIARVQMPGVRGSIPVVLNFFRASLAALPLGSEEQARVKRAVQAFLSFLTRKKSVVDDFEFGLRAARNDSQVPVEIENHGEPFVDDEA